MITALVTERLDGPVAPAVLGTLGPGPDTCPGDCCRLSAPAGRPVRPDRTS